MKFDARLFTIFVVALAALAGASRDATAQQAASSAQACASIADNALRLACYDRLLGASHADGGQAQRSESPAAPPAGTSGPAAPAAEAARAAQTPAAPRAVSAAPAAERETHTHREESRSNREASGEFAIRVVDVRRYRQRANAFLITDDGDVWRQTDGKRIQFPKTPFRAVITHGSFGSHFLQPPGSRVLISVTEERRH